MRLRISPLPTLLRQRITLKSKQEQLENYRRKANFESFDTMLREVHGGDITDMHSWLFDQSKQFETKESFNEIKSDFNLWMLNRGISIHE